MKTIKGPGIFIAQFIKVLPSHFNDLKSICEWAKSLNFTGVQLPTLDEEIYRFKKKAAESGSVC